MLPARSSDETPRDGSRSSPNADRAFRAAVDQQVIISTTDLAGRITEANEPFCRISGYSRDELIGANHRLLNSGQHPREFWVEMWKTVSSGRVWRAEVCNRAKNGELYWVETAIGPMRDDTGAITGYVSVRQDVTERKRGEHALRRLNQVQEEMGRVARVGGWEFEPATGRTTWTREMFEIFEVSPEYSPALASSLAHFEGDAAKTVEDLVKRAAETGEPFDYTVPFVTAKGRHLWVRGIGKSERRSDGSSWLYGALQDVTESHLRNLELGAALEAAQIRTRELQRAGEELRRSEEQLRQAHKLEAIGRLAGGVAHDFNNLLMVILGQCDFVAEDEGLSPDVRAALSEIRTAGERAANLTRQLLAFSRQQVLQPRVIDLNEVVESLRKMLGRLLREDIALRAVAASRSSRVLADRGQIEQVLMNLVVNARDAMPQGGELVIETHDVEIGPHDPEIELGARPGPHVRLSVRDTGTGMDAETVARVFEPFFTTKEQGKGTGLGLATVFGIVKQSGGVIAVESTPGRGSTFRIHLPRAADDARPDADEPGPAGGAGGSETVLLAEDDAHVRRVIAAMLRGRGYQVLEAKNGEEALRHCQRHDEPIHLLLTDVIMPGMNGRELYERAIDVRPGLQVVFMSGYTDDVIAQTSPTAPGIAFLQKPFAPQALAKAVRDALDASRAAPRRP